MKMPKPNFRPDTSLYGRDVILLDEDGRRYNNGTLTLIVTAHSYVLNMAGMERTWEVDSTDCFFEHEGQLYLQNAWE